MQQYGINVTLTENAALALRELTRRINAQGRTAQDEAATLNDLFDTNTTATEIAVLAMVNRKRHDMEAMACR